jgi:hypothetical protein
MERLRSVRDIMAQPPCVENDLVFDKVCRLGEEGYAVGGSDDG